MTILAGHDFQVVYQEDVLYFVIYPLFISQFCISKPPILSLFVICFYDFYFLLHVNLTILIKCCIASIVIWVSAYILKETSIFFYFVKRATAFVLIKLLMTENNTSFCIGFIHNSKSKHKITLSPVKFFWMFCC